MGKSSVRTKIDKMEQLATTSEAAHVPPIATSVASASQAALASEADPKITEDIDAQIRRLRQVLSLMAPETGSVAFGSARRPTTRVPVTERIRLLTEYRR
jgi:3-oxoacyl-ACP reductase-like protein